MSATPADEDLPAPFHHIPGLPNFRDLGGVAWPIAGAQTTVRAGVVYRSSEPSRVTDAGVARLQALGIRKVYDLRSRREIERDAAAGQDRPVREWPGAERFFVPVFLDADYSPEAVAVRFRQYADESEVSFFSERFPPSRRGREGLRPEPPLPLCHPRPAGRPTATHTQTRLVSRPSID